MVSGSGLIHSETLAIDVSTPDAATSTTSRSVKIPTTRVPSVTTTDPTLRSFIRVLASETVSDGEAVSTWLDITSETVRVLAPSAMHHPFIGRFGALSRVYEGPITDQLGGEAHDGRHPEDARTPSGNNRETWRRDRRHRARLGVAQAPSTRHDRNVDGGQPAAEGVRHAQL